MAVYQVDQGVDAVEKIGRDFGGFLAKRADRATSCPRSRGDPIPIRASSSASVSR